MSESIFKSTPDRLTPVYNDVFCIVESANSELDGFQYRYTIEVDEVEVAKGTVRPMPNGDGKVNMSRILQSFLTYKELLPVGSVANIVKGSMVNAKVIIGEEYNASAWSFFRYGSVGTSSLFWTNRNDESFNPNGLTRTMIWEQDLTAPDFGIGDLITVNQTGGGRSELQGIQKVIDIEEVDDTILGVYIGYIVVLELVWIGWSTPSGGEGGTAISSTFEKVITENIGTHEFTVWNGALSFVDFKDYTVGDWDGALGLWNFMTSAPRGGYPIREDSAVFLQFGNVHNAQERLEIKSGANSGRTPNITKENNVGIVDVSFNRDTLGFIIGDYPLTDDTKEYTAQIIGNSTPSEAFKFVINRKCYEFEDVEIIFLDRLGSIMPFAFNLKNNKRSTVERVNYAKDVDTNTMYDYSLLDGGTVPVELNEKIRYTLRTDAITDAMGNYLRELISSPFTAVRFGDGEYQRCDIKTNSLDIRSRFDEGLNFYDIEIEISNPDKINW